MGGRLDNGCTLLGSHVEIVTMSYILETAMTGMCFRFNALYFREFPADKMFEQGWVPATPLCPPVYIITFDTF